MNNKNIGRSMVAGHVLHWMIMGDDFVEASKKLHRIKEGKRDWSLYSYAINLLASQVVEIAPKSIIANQICLENNDGSYKEIKQIAIDRMKQYGHHLNKLFADLPELRQAMRINRITKSKNKGGNQNSVPQRGSFVVRYS